MNVLSEAFSTASISGLWLPRYWTSSSSWQSLYRVYTSLTVMVMLLIMISQLAALTLLARNIEEIVEAAYVFLEGVNACVKGVNMLTRRHRIIQLADMFVDSKCLPKNREELDLCSYFDRISRLRMNKIFFSLESLLKIKNRSFHLSDTWYCRSWD